jgi:hypothetical protein
VILKSFVKRFGERKSRFLSGFRFFRFFSQDVPERLRTHGISGKTGIYAVGILAGMISGGILYFRFNPAGSPLFPKCPFLMLTGLKCPGCGSQRAIHALLHLDFPAACSQNILLVATLPYLFLLIAAQVIRFFSPSATFPVRIQQPAVIWTYFTLVLLFWVARNVFGF